MLQSGNAGIDKATGQPVIFDPASYYGHNEAEYENSHRAVCRLKVL